MKSVVALSAFLALTTAGQVYVGTTQSGHQNPSIYQSGAAQQQATYKTAQPQAYLNANNYQTSAQNEVATRPRILNYQSDKSNGGYQYTYETENGIRAEEIGQLEAKGHSVQGAYSYTGDDGQVYTVTYTADENGFHAQGDHIPTPPPTPDVILQSLEKNAHDEANGIFDDGKYKEDTEAYNQSNQKQSTQNQYSQVPTASAHHTSQTQISKPTASANYQTTGSSHRTTSQAQSSQQKYPQYQYTQVQSSQPTAQHYQTTGSGHHTTGYVQSSQQKYPQLQYTQAQYSQPTALASYQSAGSGHQTTGYTQSAQPKYPQIQYTQAQLSQPAALANYQTTGAGHQTIGYVQSSQPKYPQYYITQAQLAQPTVSANYQTTSTGHQTTGHAQSAQQTYPQHQYIQSSSLSPSQLSALMRPYYQAIASGQLSTGYAQTAAPSGHSGHY